MARKKSAGDRKAAKVLREFKAGTLNAGKTGPGTGPKVLSRKQALAIALSERDRVAKKRKRKAR